MKIKINDDWGIKSDKYQYMVCKIETKDGEDKYRFIKATYRTIADALEGYIEHRVRTDENITEFKEIVELQKELLEEIESIRKELDIEEEI